MLSSSESVYKQVKEVMWGVLKNERVSSFWISDAGWRFAGGGRSMF